MRCCWAAAASWAADVIWAGVMPAGMPWVASMTWACWGVIMPGGAAGGLDWPMRGVWTTSCCCCWGRLLGVATCCMLGVAWGWRGVLDVWLCWLPRADRLTAMGTAPMGGWFCTTDDGLAGLAPMLEPDDCIEAPPTMGDDMFWGVFWRTMGDEAAGCEICWWKRGWATPEAAATAAAAAWADIPLGRPLGMPLGPGWACEGWPPIWST